MIAVRDGLAFHDETVTTGPAPMPEPEPTASEPARPAAVMGEPETTTTGASPAAKRRRPSLLQRIRRRLRPTEAERRHRTIVRRLHALERERTPRLLVVQAHVRQRIDTPTGTRLMNPFLGPIIDRLRRTTLDPIEVDIRSQMADDVAWQRLRDRASARTLPVDVLGMGVQPITMRAARQEASPAADRIAAGHTPLVVSGVDLGPTLTALVAGRARRILSLALHDIPRIRALLRRLRPAGVLLADEYHRQDWLAAAAAEGIPTAAIQHGVIHPWHPGYVHRTRPATLRIPDRTYVFGAWERTLLTGSSVYRDDEVIVGGSPRLDLVTPSVADRDALRQELGVAPGDRLIVLSGTWGAMDRRFAYPIALIGLFDRPIPNVHVVVKRHPTERDEGPYQRIFDRAALDAGYPPLSLMIVQSIDLYRLLAAADAHLGIHSTLLTEAVVAGTPNLLASGLQATDLLGYVAAGVAVPVRDGADLIAALGRTRAELIDEAACAAFIRDHFEPGVASQRIADDLMGWLVDRAKVPVGQAKVPDV